MRLDGLTSSALLGLASIGKAGAAPTAASGFAPANSAEDGAAISAWRNRFTVVTAQTALDAQMLRDQQEAARANSAEGKFLDFAQKTPGEKMREQVLKALGLSEEQLAAMSPEERAAAEDKIRDLIEAKIRETMRADGVDPNDGARAEQAAGLDLLI